ncbi:hypothetical protein [Mangrovibacterium diazotrophicum]|uniref:EF-hand domain-containing protein n=1 Tax=Mangrovibacterium diazotrophicum TaxID=1261403 RepID=A0A419W741_9BACT|nr:hypothetical protein [Mangrovibacterium diazotrophicum]RKD91279.1 hypothetical protein BC643_1632 [Mangrovibacterium diazotrophicum]
MKTKLIILVIAGVFAALGSSAQNYRVSSVGYDISDNLDLEAVSYLFGESRNLEEFEEKLNDPRIQVSNLDLNNDGYVDYLRVVELYEYGIHSVTIQAVLGRNIFQDVATIDVGRQTGNTLYVQVVGDPYLYGPHYIVEPVYLNTPLIFAWFFRPSYVVWHSPYYWGYYPTRYRSYACLPTYRYHKHLHVHVDYHVNTYHYSQSRRSPRAIEIQHSVRRNDYGQQHPDRSFSSRNSGYSNKYEMNRNRSVNEQRARGNSSGTTSNSRPSYSQRNSTSPGTSNKTATSTKSTRSTTATPSSSSQQKRTYQSSSSGNGNSSRTQPATTGQSRSTYQRSETKTTNSGSGNSGVKKQTNSRTSSSTNSGYSSSRSTRKVESTSSSRSNNANVSRSSSSSGQSVSRKSSSKPKEAKASSSRTSSRSDSRTERSRRN